MTPQATAWIALFCAGLFEVGWPLGLKLANKPGMVVWGTIVAVACMAVSGGLLWFSLRHIPIGTAYAVWTGIGAAGTFLLGVVVFGDPNLVLRWLGFGAIVGGVILLKLGS